jgi:hypothetical protein
VESELGEFFGEFGDPLIDGFFISEQHFELLFLKDEFESNNLIIRLLKIVKKLHYS